MTVVTILTIGTVFTVVSSGKNKATSTHKNYATSFSLVFLIMHKLPTYLPTYLTLVTVATVVTVVTVLSSDKNHKTSQQQQNLPPLFFSCYFWIEQLDTFDNRCDVLRAAFVILAMFGYCIIWISEMSTVFFLPY